MADKLLIILINTDPANKLESMPPLNQASVAAAMEYDVEVIFSGQASKLAVVGVAEKLVINKEKDKEKTVYDMIKTIKEAGGVLKICANAAEEWGAENIIEEIEETVGGAYVISEAMDDNTVTMTY